MDRNKAIILADGLRCESLSARRAWIEIKVPEDQYTALSSLSARRAWIEIVLLSYNQCVAVVALRKESVDRNSLMVSLLFSFSARRSPQGERG